ncbi:M48 family metallopeptidase [Streptomyces chiangmaiensis]|uniref:M48 family metallopeptidase n=1 Tax=Streptomyces chiangmaiensis TaxID=766497 RepID=A0ABU7FV00_9ACTN|nr:M48 family metallopeptidase [Streptomyces chiangmaiensis]MED7827358.1 M48 family metallopeptidase [Streptomyces chiangmaiensis]
MRTPEEKSQSCPECGAEIRADSRYVAWCAACDWNVDPETPHQKRDRLDRVRRALSRRHGEKLLAEVTAGGSLRARRDASSLLAFAIALAVHGVTVALVLGGVWWLVRGWGGVGMVPGLLLLALAWPLRPRAARLPKADPILHRDDAPELYALVDEVAQVVGTRGIDEVRVDTKVNASVMAHGVRGRRLLMLGVPLWEILTPQQRIALLGHELAHYSNGDTRQGLVVSTAYRSLTTWHYYFTPIAKPSAAEMFINLLYIVPRLLLQGVLTLLDHLTLRATQRAEYLADREAARAASTEAAVGLMDRLLVTESAAAALRREASQAALAGRRGARTVEAKPEEIWERLRAHMASIPEYEYERQRRAGVRRGHSVDATHPPTHLRRTCLLVGPAAPAAVVTDDERQRRIAAELAGARVTVARRIVREGFDG